MTTEASQQQDALWLCSMSELERAVKEYAKEFQIDKWDNATAEHFLQLKFHFVKGSMVKDHIDEVVRIGCGEGPRFGEGNPAGLRQSDGVSSITYKLGSYLLSQRRFYAEKERSYFWMYDEHAGIWRPNATEYIRGFVARYLSKTFKTHNQNELLGYLKSISYPITPGSVTLGGPAGKIVVANGMLNTETGELSEFSPDEYHIAALPVKYDLNADCPKFKHFLEEVLTKEEDRMAVVEHLGSCLHKVAYPNILVLLGKGANGKSVLLDVVRSFLGTDSISFATLQQLEERFQKSQLMGKLANIGDDIPADALRQTGWIKMLTGGVPIQAEFKNQDPFSFLNHAKLWFSANDLPGSPDVSDAFHRRMHVIEFTRVFGPDDPKTIPMEVLLKDLTSEEELSGILNLALEGLHRLRAQGHLSGRKSIEESRVDYLRRSDSIQYFAYRYVEHDTYAEPVPKSELYDLYMRLCHTIGKIPTSDGWFAKRLKRIVPYMDERRSTQDGDRVTAWTGIHILTDLLRADGVNIDGIVLAMKKKELRAEDQKVLMADAAVHAESDPSDFALAGSGEQRWTDLIRRLSGEKKVTAELMEQLYDERERHVIGMDFLEWEKAGRVCRVLNGKESHWLIMEGSM